MAKVTVTDPTGQELTVGRWWYTPAPWQTGLQSIDALIYLFMLPFMVANASSRSRRPSRPGPCHWTRCESVCAVRNSPIARAVASGWSSITRT